MKKKQQMQRSHHQEIVSGAVSSFSELKESIVSNVEDVME
jgi:hypothetical protein